MKLLDNFGRIHNYLRISVTEKCNFRCTYCMPEEGVELSKNVLERDEISKLVRIFIQMLGVNKIRITGGEPTVRKDLEGIISDIRSYPEIETIGITSNGALLPRKLEGYALAGLDTVNISLDSLIPAKNRMITRRENTTEKAIKAVDKAVELGLKTKLNVVAMRGFNEDELLDFVTFIKDKPVELRFIEFMPFDSNQWANKKFLPFFEQR